VAAGAEIVQIADLAGVRALLRGGGAARATAARPTGPRRQGQLPGQGGKVGALWLGHAAILGRARGRDRARSKPWEVTVTVTVTVTVSVCGKCDYRSATQRTSAPVSSSRTPCDRASYESAHLAWPMYRLRLRSIERAARCIGLLACGAGTIISRVSSLPPAPHPAKTVPRMCFSPERVAEGMTERQVNVEYDLQTLTNYYTK